MTKTKRIAAALLLAFVFLSIGYLTGKERRRPGASETPPAQPSAAPSARDAAPTPALSSVPAASPVPETLSSPAAETPGPSAPPTPFPTPIPPRYAPGETHVTVFFFHRKERCPTCRKIEEWTGTTMGSLYGEDLEDGKMEWRVYCIEDASAARFREQFDLFTSTVVLAEVREGKVVRHRDLVEEVWSKVNGTEEDFVKYLKGEIDEFRGVSPKAGETP